MERMTRELRGATHVTAIGSNAIRIDRFSCGTCSTTISVIYDCSVPAGPTFNCVRQQGATTRVVATGVTNQDVFEYSPTHVNPNFVGIKLMAKVPAGDGRKGHTIRPFVLMDGVNLRNLTIAN
jgi:hypothetical protein